MKRLWPLPLLCLAALLPAAAPPAGPSATEVTRLIGRLGDDDFSVREVATARLMLAGEPDLPALHKALAHDDPEVRRRARRIVAAIESRLYPELRLVGHTSRLCSVCVSADGKRLLSASYDATVRVWDVESGKELKQIQAHKQHTYRAAFSPDGKRIVSGGEDDSVRVWDAQSGKELSKYAGHGTTEWRGAAHLVDERRTFSSLSATIPEFYSNFWPT